MIKRIAMLAGAILLASVPIQSQAQGAQTPAPNLELPIVRTLSRLEANTRVRVRTGPTIIEGNYTGFNPQGVALRGASVASPIPLESIDEMWKRSRSTVQGAIAGGVTGAILVGAFGVLVVSGFCEQPDGCRGDYPTAIFFGGAIGAAGGGLLGAGIGSLVKRWERIHP
ncbi:MAG TPA: hypothetical protein VM099_13375 [Gemmatimonadaceae bacterium]|nr:hypothetical protein [Gemmatimonadaceae bacterium]